MSKKVLVAYASVSGSTGEIADAIGKVLTECGAAVQVSHVRDVSGVVGYHAVVLGSSIRSGQWLPGALQFLDVFRALLSHIPVSDSVDSHRTVLAYMEPILQRAPEVKPVGLGLFAGSLEPGQQLPSTSTLRVPPSHPEYGCTPRWSATMPQKIRPPSSGCRTPGSGAS